ncbi:hypothetical protein L596_016001 [Steinernema carpocapsae]|uniref:Uncharacterized protein n=1 Tax=Steinernema carpocapsae TaxID=34508 RepID=A0A4U5NHR5_STECR|nr:hypothetical protein L596_016001 [Steinernema carpocapsae]
MTKSYTIDHGSVSDVEIRLKRTNKTLFLLAPQQPQQIFGRRLQFLVTPDLERRLHVPAGRAPRVFLNHLHVNRSSRRTQRIFGFHRVDQAILLAESNLL